MQSVSTFLLKHGVSAGRRILKEISFPPTEVIPYSGAELSRFFSACTQDEDLLFKFFLHSMARDMKVAHCEVCDLDFNKNLLHICPKPDRGFRLKGKRSRQDVRGRKVPLPVRLMERLKAHSQGKEPNSLVFPDRNGNACTHFLYKCKRIARHAGLENWPKFGLHRWRKTGATRYHEAGVSVRTIQYRLGHESLEVTLDYLGVQHAEDENSHGAVNNGPLSRYV
jgi:integrase